MKKRPKNRTERMTEIMQTLMAEFGFTAISVYVPDKTTMPEGEAPVRAFMMGTDPETLERACLDYLSELGEKPPN
jgi:hypothetical protein